MSCLTGCGLRGSWAPETQWAGAATPAPKGFHVMKISTSLLILYFMYMYNVYAGILVG